MTSRSKRKKFTKKWIMIDKEDEKEDDLQSHWSGIPSSVSSEYVPEARSLLKMKKNNQKNKKRSLKTSQSSDFESILLPPDTENGSIYLAMWPVCLQMWQRRFSYSYFISASLLFVCMCVRQSVFPGRFRWNFHGNVSDAGMSCLPLSWRASLWLLSLSLYLLLFAYPFPHPFPDQSFFLFGPLCPRFCLRLHRCVWWLFILQIVHANLPLLALASPSTMELWRVVRSTNPNAPMTCESLRTSRFSKNRLVWPYVAFFKIADKVTEMIFQGNTRINSSDMANRLTFERIQKSFYIHLKKIPDCTGTTHVHFNAISF